MWRTNRIAGLMALTASVVLAMAVISSTAAYAVTHAREANQASVSRTHKATQHGISQPAGCNKNNLCEYNQGNGGDLCFQTDKSRAWPHACAFHNEGEYNRNGNSVTLKGKVGDDFRCTYLLYSGHYLLYNAKDHFQGSGDTCTRATLEHKLWANIFT
jgi:hypothetical protein